MENRIKDCQLDLFANRMSAHAYKANQLRLLLLRFTALLLSIGSPGRQFLRINVDTVVRQQF